MEITVKELKELMDIARKEGKNLGRLEMEAERETLENKYSILLDTNNDLHSELFEAKKRIDELEKFNMDWENENELLKENYQTLDKKYNALVSDAELSILHKNSVISELKEEHKTIPTRRKG